MARDSALGKSGSRDGDKEAGIERVKSRTSFPRSVVLRKHKKEKRRAAVRWIQDEAFVITHPNLFFVPTSPATSSTARNRQPQVDAATTVTTRERGILGLRIHTRRLSAHAQMLRDERVGVKRGMRLLDREEATHSQRGRGGSCRSWMARRRRLETLEKVCWRAAKGGTASAVLSDAGRGEQIILEYQPLSPSIRSEMSPVSCRQK